MEQIPHQGGEVQHAQISPVPLHEHIPLQPPEDHESPDERVIREGIAQAHQAGTDIDNRTARYIAAQLHEGQTSALYTLASTGAIADTVDDELSRGFDRQTDQVQTWITWFGRYCLSSGCTTKHFQNHPAFSKPPHVWPEHGETEFRRGLSRLARDATLGIVIAQAENELIGFAYGHTLNPDTKWWDGFIVPVPEEVTTEREGRTFALIDFVVAEAWRGRDIGRRLHDTLLSSRPEACATLAVEPVAHEARAI